MPNTDIIFSVALEYAQKTGKQPQITNNLIRNMQNDLAQLATEYAVYDTYDFFKEEE